MNIVVDLIGAGVVLIILGVALWDAFHPPKDRP